MNSMRYNPSQALRLLLDPLISAVFRQVETDFRGFCIQSTVNRRLHTLDVLMDTSYPVNLFPCRACPATGLLHTLIFYHHSIRQESKKDRRPANSEKNTHLNRLNPAQFVHSTNRTDKKSSPINFTLTVFTLMA
ncbi:hypothetical protein [Pantoea agglomerans]|uniref:hypothetical protein n=1 Tax=Enterobacter agglomerans TaxID=549 RepID=UPI0012DB1B06|nr:hypothetical protein [Pantoea agglomerans]